MNISLNKYLIYVIANKLIHQWSWVTSLLGIHTNGFSNEYIKIIDNVGYVTVDGTDLALTSYVKDDAFIHIGTDINIPNDTLPELTKDVSTTVGIFFINYILLGHPFSGRLGYIFKDVSLSRIIDLVKEGLTSEAITVDEYKRFVISCTYLESFNKLVTPASTSKSMLPPPGLDAYKVTLRSKFVELYGSDWDTDPSRVVEYDNSLKEFYEEYIKDDPSNGIIANKKNKGNALAKKYLTFSTTNAFGEQVHVDESLMDGYPDNPEQLVAMFNTTRAASFSRGAETQKGGAVAKSVLRATSSISIKDTDCGVTYGKSTLVTKDNMSSLIGRYIIENKKPVILSKDGVSKYVDTTVVLRSPMYCVISKPNFCAICMGGNAAGHANGVSLMVTNISSILTIAALKAMHNSQIATVKVSLDKMVS